MYEPKYPLNLDLAYLIPTYKRAHNMLCRINMERYYPIHVELKNKGAWWKADQCIA